MLSPYANLLRTPGVRRFVLGRSLGQLGGAMFGVSVVAMVAARRDSFELAGAVSSAGLVVLALSAPLVGMLVDRHGQSKVSLPLLLWCGTWVAVMVGCSLTGAPTWMLFVTYALACVVAQFSTMSRARWSHLLREDPERLHTAMSMEQVIDELSFAIGPALAVALSVIQPELGLGAAGVFYVIGGLIFLSSRWTEPPVVPHHERPAGVAAAKPAILILTLILTMTGVIFGANEVTTIAVAKEAGQEAMAGAILGLFALGSAVAGLYYGTRTTRMPLPRQLVFGTLGMAALEAPVLLARDLVPLAGVLTIAGMATAPTLIIGISLAQRVLPEAQINEGLMVIMTGLTIGVAAGAAISGRIIERVEAHAGYSVAVAVGVLSCVFALAAYLMLVRRERQQATA